MHDSAYKPYTNSREFFEGRPCYLRLPREGRQAPAGAPRACHRAPGPPSPCPRRRIPPCACPAQEQTIFMITVCELD